METAQTDHIYMYTLGCVNFYRIPWPRAKYMTNYFTIIDLPSIAEQVALSVKPFKYNDR